MAVTQCHIVPESRQVIEIQGGRKYRLRFKITSDTPSDSQSTILAGARSAAHTHPLPVINDAWNYDTNDPTAVVNRVTINQDQMGAAEIWYADVEWDKASADQVPPEQQDDNPLDRPTIWWLENSEELEPVEKDNGQARTPADSGRPLRNSAGQEFIDPIMIERNYPILAGRRNVRDLTSILQWNETYDRSVNSVAFQGRPVRTWRFLPIESGELQFENNVSFYPAVFRFLYDATTWDIDVVDQGFHYLDHDDLDAEGQPKLKRCKDSENNPTAEPCLLVLDVGVDKAPGEIGDIKTFRVRPELDFNTLATEARL